MNGAVSSDDITVDTIVESVRESIIRGDLPPGTIVNSVDIANQFGTSRTPVREALLILSQYGLITLAARRRPQVAPVSAKAIRNLYDLRAALHAYMSDAIVANASDEALRDLQAHAAALASEPAGYGDEAYMLRIEAYLATEAQLCGNDLVIGVLDSLKWKISWFRRIGKMTEEQVKSLAADRLRVAQAYLDRDARLARALNRSMLKRGGDYCENNFLGTHPPGTTGK
ncbi:GntR family transcriptional regulator [Variovorax sp. GT1P44]|uniref:GntR family transcriptional regulator n=1 Tax=Variovorax sp. GT1P44 TaxID=3443742 RepID=UPI003F482B7D